MQQFGKYGSFANFRSAMDTALSSHLAATPKSAATQKYRIEHCRRVAKIGRQLADAENMGAAEAAWLEIGCLLHDIGKWDAQIPVDHGRAGALVVKDLLEKAQITAEEYPLAAQVVQGIAMHVDGQWNPRADEGSDTNKAGQPYLYFSNSPTLLARVIGECDDIDRYSVYRIHDTLRYVDFLAKSTAEQISWIEKYLAHLESICATPRHTPHTQRWWKENIDFQIFFFQKLRAEIS